MTEMVDPAAPARGRRGRLRSGPGVGRPRGPGGGRRLAHAAVAGDVPRLRAEHRLRAARPRAVRPSRTSTPPARLPLNLWGSPGPGRSPGTPRWRRARRPRRLPVPGARPQPGHGPGLPGRPGPVPGLPRRAARGRRARGPTSTPTATGPSPTSACTSSSANRGRSPTAGSRSSSSTRAWRCTASRSADEGMEWRPTSSSISPQRPAPRAGQHAGPARTHAPARGLTDPATADCPSHAQQQLDDGLEPGCWTVGADMMIALRTAAGPAHSGKRQIHDGPVPRGRPTVSS